MGIWETKYPKPPSCLCSTTACPTLLAAFSVWLYYEKARQWSTEGREVGTGAKWRSDAFLVSHGTRLRRRSMRNDSITKSGTDDLMAERRPFPGVVWDLPHPGIWPFWFSFNYGRIQSCWVSFSRSPQETIHIVCFNKVVWRKVIKVVYCRKGKYTLLQLKPDSMILRQIINI